MYRFNGLLLGAFGEAANMRGSVEVLGSRQEDVNPGWLVLAVVGAKTLIGSSQQTSLWGCRDCRVVFGVLYCLQTYTETFTGQFKAIGLLKIYIYIPVTGIKFSNSQEVKRFFLTNWARMTKRKCFWLYIIEKTYSRYNFHLLLYNHNRGFHMYPILLTKLHLTLSMSECVFPTKTSMTCLRPLLLH